MGGPCICLSLHQQSFLQQMSAEHRPLPGSALHARQWRTRQMGLPLAETVNKRAGTKNLSQHT